VFIPCVDYVYVICLPVPLLSLIVDIGYTAHHSLFHYDECERYLVLNNAALPAEVPSVIYVYGIFI
jgi:hypothetical protein